MIQKNLRTRYRFFQIIGKYRIVLRQITPRFSYLLSSKVYIDINIPLCFFDSYYHADKEDNPAMPISERTIHAYEFSSFPTIFSGRIGIGIKI